jgi:hypothetical protein
LVVVAVAQPSVIQPNVGLLNVVTMCQDHPVTNFVNGFAAPTPTVVTPNGAANVAVEPKQRELSLKDHPSPLDVAAPAGTMFQAHPVTNFVNGYAALTPTAAIPNVVANVAVEP